MNQTKRTVRSSMMMEADLMPAAFAHDRLQLLLPIWSGGNVGIEPNRRAIIRQNNQLLLP